MKTTWNLLTFPLVIVALAFPLGAQQGQQTTGSIVGRVTDRVTGQPVAEANVVIVGSTRGGRTSEEGRYRVAGVPAGTHAVRVTRLGYTAETRPATVAARQEVTVDFQIGQTAVQIDEVVVTATGETQRRRETGNAVSVVQPAPEQLATTTNIAQILAAATPGVYVSSPGGTTGSANRIRIRGANSISLSNEPLIIIDGVRASNEIGGTGNIGVGGQTSSRLNDINPDDIESMEILKGPAAAALYGTAAASGVIQIRTKRGRPGRTQWTSFAEGGSQEDVHTYPANFAQVGRTGTGGRTVFCTLDAQARRLCTPVADSLVSWNPLEQASPFIRGWRSSVGLGVAGGGDVASYYVSGDLDRDQGVFEPNSFKRASLRANLTSQLRPDVNLQVSTNYISSRLEFPQNDNNILGIFGGGLLGSAFDDPPPPQGTGTRGYIAGQIPQEIFALDVRENVERFVGSATSNWQVTNWLTMVGTAGVDFFDRRNKSTVPPNRVFFGSLPEGQRTSNTAQIWNYTANIGATAAFAIRPDLRSQTTLGIQFTEEMVQGTRAFGAKLLAGTGSLEGTAARFAVGETNTDNRTLGALASQQFSWRDRLFVTGAARTDRNSAFGENFGWSLYPALSLSYVISEEAFFPQTNVLSSLRLRSSYGRSGQRPSFRNAITFFSTQTVTVGGTDVPGIIVGGTGNPDLKPELSTEYELGFEAGFFGARAGLDVTYYNKRTRDLLIARPLPPSLGLTTSQFANLGASSNAGLELQLNAQLLNRPVWTIDPVRFDLTITGSTNKNRLVDLGRLPNGDPIPPIVFGTQRHVNNYPLGGFWDEGISFEDKNGDGIISRVNCPGQAQVVGGPECEIFVSDTAVYLGNPIPTREFSVSPRLTLWSWLELSALVDHKGGFKAYNLTERFRCNFANCRAAYDANTSLFEQARNLGHLMGTDAGYIEDASFTKLRELAVSLTAPRRWAARARVEGLRLTIAGRNLKTWTDYTGFDPEVSSQPGTNFTSWDFLTQPPLRIISTRLTVQF